MSQKLKLLLDENMGVRIYEELKKMGLDVQSVMLIRRGMKDSEVIEIAKIHNKITLL